MRRLRIDREYPLKPDSSGNDRAGLQRLAMELAAGERPGGELLRITVTGVSMLPTLRPGDIILVQPGPSPDLKPGALATFLTDAGPVTHRIVGVDGEVLIAKGDNARRLDPRIPASRIIGRVVAGIRVGVERSFRTGARTALTARLSYLEGRISERFDPSHSASFTFKLVVFPLRLLVAISAYLGLPR